MINYIKLTNHNYSLFKFKLNSKYVSRSVEGRKTKLSYYLLFEVNPKKHIYLKN